MNGEAGLRRAFRYLKRGVFPPERLDELTCGRGAELSAIDHGLSDVAAGASRHVFLEGAYGRGKSHMLKAIEALGLRNDFGVCWVTLDGYNHACNHPTRYLHSLFESLRLPSLPHRGLAGLVEHWVRTEDKQLLTWAMQSNCWASWPILRLWSTSRSGGEAPWLNAALESRDLVHRNGRPWFDSVITRLDGLAKLVRAMGYRGIVYLFDELETVATLLSSIRQRLLAYEFLHQLVDARKHSHCYFVFAGTPDFGDKVSVDRMFKGRYDYEYADACRFMDRWHSATLDRTTLKPLGGSDLIKLCKLLREHHERAFGWPLKHQLSDDFIRAFVAEAQRFALGPREVSRSFVNLLELAEQYREASIENLVPFRNQLLSSPEREPS